MLAALNRRGAAERGNKKPGPRARTFFTALGCRGLPHIFYRAGLRRGKKSQGRAHAHFLPRRSPGGAPPRTLFTAPVSGGGAPTHIIYRAGIWEGRSHAHYLSRRSPGGAPHRTLFTAPVSGRGAPTHIILTCYHFVAAVVLVLNDLSTSGSGGLIVLVFSVKGEVSHTVGNLSKFGILTIGGGRHEVGVGRDPRDHERLSAGPGSIP